MTYTEILRAARQLPQDQLMKLVASLSDAERKELNVSAFEQEQTLDSFCDAEGVVSVRVITNPHTNKDFASFEGAKGSLRTGYLSPKVDWEAVDPQDIRVAILVSKTGVVPTLFVPSTNNVKRTLFTK